MSNATQNGDSAACPSVSMQEVAGRDLETSHLGQGFEVVGRTVASMIVEPDHRHMALGIPCKSRFVTLSIDA